MSSTPHLRVSLPHALRRPTDSCAQFHSYAIPRIQPSISTTIFARCMVGVPLPVEGRPPQSVFEISVGFRIDLGAVAAL
jgi:hypothetical protein